MKQGSKLGEGTFGIVYVGIYPESKDQYAVKRNLVEKKTSFIGSLRETDILKKLSGHPNIIQLEKIAFNTPFEGQCFSPIPNNNDRKTQRDDSLHFVFEKAQCDLYSFIRNAKNIMDFTMHKKYMVDILLGLEYMHGMKIIHRDLKPSNILILDDVAKICDFGLAKPYTYQGLQTPGVVTAWYRAPEIALGYPHYDYKSDVWSMACIFYEMISNRCFLKDCPDNNDSVISHILAQLPKELSKTTRVSLITSNPWRTVKVHGYANPKSKRKSFLEKLSLTSDGKNSFNKSAGNINLFCDLLDKMFEFDWQERYNITQCLDHPFFDDYREIIQTIRSYYPIVSVENPITVKPCVERKWVKEVIIDICKKKPIRWFSYRSLFQAVELFDKYLMVMHKNTVLKGNEIESDIKGLIHDKFNTILRFYACLYMCVKYFSSLGFPISYDEIVEREYKTNEAKNIVEMFEASFISYGLNYDIYETTIYEIADLHDKFLLDEEIYELLMMRINDDELCNILPSQLYLKYIDKLT